MKNRDGKNGKRGSQIRAVILDYGEVLCERPKRELLNGMAEVFGVEPAQFLELYKASRDPYDQGKITAEEYWENFAQRAGVSVDRAVIERLRGLDTEMWSGTSPEMLRWVTLLNQAGLTTALLSNMQHDMAAYARKNFAWLGDFDHQILSCEVGLIKPDAAIFRESIERIGTKPQEILFVDDRQANVDGAKSTGIEAIRFEGIKRLREDLEEMGFAVLPEVSRGDGAV